MWFWVAAAFFTSLPSYAGSFEDTFVAWTEAQKPAQELVSATGATPVEQKLERARFAHDHAAAQARFTQLLGSPDLSPWQRALFTDASSALPPGTDLSSALPHARDFSPFEWDSLGRLIGAASRDSLLRNTFAFETVRAPASVPSATAQGHLLWVVDPFARFLPTKLREAEKSEREQAAARLEKAGYTVEMLELGAYAHADDLAEELHLVLLSRDEDEPFTLVTSGHASAILHRCFDLNPILMHQQAIRGWVSADGRLFGASVPATGRKLSAIATSPAQLPEQEARRELFLLHQEGRERQPPLRAEFPLVNALSKSFEAEARKQGWLRETIEPEGRTVLGSSFAETVEAGLGSLPR